jgi:hypothetical protein
MSNFIISFFIGVEVFCRYVEVFGRLVDLKDAASSSGWNSSLESSPLASIYMDFYIVKVEIKKRIAIEMMKGEIAMKEQSLLGLGERCCALWFLNDSLLIL